MNSRRGLMLIKRLFILFIVCMMPTAAIADQVTTNYKLVIPEFTSRGWGRKLSEDIVSIDNIMKMVSDDSTWVGSSGTVTTRSGVTQATVGGILSIDSHLIISAETSTTGLTASELVGRIEILSSDGVSKCYIPIFLGG